MSLEQFSYDPQRPQARGSVYDQYLYGRSLIRAADEKPDWQQTMTGRILTRMVTRGVFGALAFTWAGSYAHRSMRNYDPQSIRNFSEWSKALINPRVVTEVKGDINSYINKPNTMQAIAKVFDVVAGKPISGVARALGGKDGDIWAQKAVQFRPRAMYHDPISKIRPDAEWGNRFFGRSLGHEVVAITTDFAAASAADASMRFVVQAIDPNVEKDDEKAMRDKGQHAQFDWYRNGHFSVGAFGKDALKKMWQVVSFNSGEDWAVAVPYAFFMKWHRNVIDKLSPGFKYASDNGSWNGACDKVRAIIKPHPTDPKQNHIADVKFVGDFQAEAAWDLQARFTMYNVLTLMYRETYRSVGNALSQWWKGPSWIPSAKLPERPIEAAIEGAGDTVRYGVKSFIKANLYMQPVVPFFWSWRVPQNKWRGSPIFINDKNDPHERLPGGSMVIPSKVPNTVDDIYKDTFRTINDTSLVNAYKRDAMRPKDPMSTANVGRHMTGNHSISGNDMMQGNVHQAYVGSHSVNPSIFQNHDPYEAKNAKTTFASMVGPFGRVSNSAGNWLGGRLGSFGDKGMGIAATVLGSKYVPQTGESTDVIRQKQRSALMNGARTFVDASFAYTPYMIAKAETARRWDNKDMDSAIYRLMDGVVSFNLAETKAALKDIGNVLTNPPPTVEDPGALQDKDETKPDTKVAAASVSRAALVHPEHRTLQ